MWISVASVTDTGFWEGTVQDREGWFPAHHVQEVKLRNKGKNALNICRTEFVFSRIWISSFSVSGILG